MTHGRDGHLPATHRRIAADFVDGSWVGPGPSTIRRPGCATDRRAVGYAVSSWMTIRSTADRVGTARRPEPEEPWADLVVHGRHAAPIAGVRLDRRTPVLRTGPTILRQAPRAGVLLSVAVTCPSVTSISARTRGAVPSCWSASIIAVPAAHRRHPTGDGTTPQACEGRQGAHQRDHEHSTGFRRAHRATRAHPRRSR